MREKWKEFENDLENNLEYAKHAIFATEPSSVKVAKTSREKPKNQKFENFLSVFRDWKVYLRESCTVSRENLCVPLMTRPSTHEQVAILSREKHKNPNFEKYSK